LKLNCNFILFTLLAALALVGSGCAGINTGASVSPIDFFMPGAAHLLRAEPKTTNAPASFTETTAELASAK
jgi:hypothetical protein